jgi:hypothetical protein
MLQLFDPEIPHLFFLFSIEGIFRANFPLLNFSFLKTTTIGKKNAKNSVEKGWKFSKSSDRPLQVPGSG